MVLLFAPATTGCLSPYEAENRCPVCGMPVNIYDGPKGKIIFSGMDKISFCSTADMFQVLTQPGFNHKDIQKIEVQNVEAAGWKEPEGHWVDARKAFYVGGSDMKAAMGGTFASFSTRKEAKKFKEKHGGEVLKFNEIDGKTVKKYTRFD